MTKSLDNQVSYSGGEWSPLLDSRVDHPGYGRACRQLWNMIAMKQGGATRRPGTIKIAPTKYLTSANLTVKELRFQFSPTTSFVFEFGHFYIRFYSNRQQVTLSTAPLWVSGTTYQPGAFVEDPTDANRIYFYTGAFAFASTIAPHLDFNWTLQSIYEVPSPYPADTGAQNGAEVNFVVPCQINDVVYLVHPRYPPYRLTRLGDTNWKMELCQFLDPPMLDQNATNTTIAASATTGNGINLTASAPAWATTNYYAIGNSVLQGGSIYNCLVGHVAGTFATDLANGYWERVVIFQNAHIGSRWKLSQAVAAKYLSYDIVANGTSGNIQAFGTYEISTFGVWNADVALQRSLDNGATWLTILTIVSREDHNTSVPGSALHLGLFRFVVSNYTAPGTPGDTTPRVEFSIANTLLSGIVQITGATPYTATANVVTELAGTAATQFWSEGAWSALRGYPRAVTAFQQRTVYGGSQFEPQRIWGSVTNDIENFDLGDQTKDTDSFAFDIAAVGRGPIQWLLAQSDLFCGFSGAEWIINAGGGSFGGSPNPITPTAINAGEHSSWGSANGIPPAVIGNAVLYTQRSAKTIQQMLFSVYTNKYMSADLTSLSEHLFGAGIVQIDYQPQFRNQGIVWVVTQAGSLCGMTYQLEQEVFGWHRHTTGDTLSDIPDAGFISVAVIEGQGVDDDEVWVAVKRASGIYIELMNPDNWETSGTAVEGIAQPDIPSAIYVDAAVTFTSPATNVLSGLTHLVGRNVIGLLNGNISLGPMVVAGDGSVTIDGYEPTAGDVIQIGLPFTYAVQSMRLDLDPRAGVTQGLTKVLSKVFLRLFNSLGGNVSNGAKAVPINYRLATTPLGQGPPIFTGQKDIQPFSTFSADPPYIITASDPFPITLLGTTVRYDIAGST